MDKKIVIMNVVELDADGVINTSMERYSSVESAKEEAEHIIEKWLNSMLLTTSDENENDGLDLALRDDYDNLIVIQDSHSIAELDVHIKEFSIE